MKLSDVIISTIIKKGTLYEARNVDTTIEIPVRTYDDSGTPLDVLKTVTIHFKTDHMTLRIEKE